MSFIQLCSSLTGYYSHLRSKYDKRDSYPTLSFSRKGQRDGHWRSSSAGLSPVMSTSKTACDPLLSFVCGAAAANEPENMQPDSSSEASIEEIHSDDTVLERYGIVSFCWPFFLSLIKYPNRHSCETNLPVGSSG